MADERLTFMVEDAKIIFRNFAGKASKYNNEGERNFCVVLDPETATQMATDGWNVRTGKSHDDDEEVGEPYIPVKVSFKVRPPRIVMITSTGRTHLDEEMVEVLDYADIQKVDLICNASFWEVNGKSGIKAYLKTMFVTINEDELERKYASTLADDE